MKSNAILAVAPPSFEQRRIEYLYSHGGKYLLVPNTPVEVSGFRYRLQSLPGRIRSSTYQRIRLPSLTAI